MSDKEYRLNAIRLATNQEIFVASVKAHQRLAYHEWLAVMGLMETWDLTSD